MNSNNGVILLTGSNGGLGQGVARYLFKSGIRNIACHYHINKNEISSILSEYDLDPEKHLFRANLINEKEVIFLRESIFKTLGPVYNLINLIGGSTNSMSWKISKAEFQKVLDMNLITAFLCCREFVPYMRAQQKGRIINVSSIVGFHGIVGASHYCAAKMAIVGFSKALALEVATKNITVNVLGLGYFDAGLIKEVPEPMKKSIVDSTPMKRLGKTEEIGGCIKYLLSEEANFITGQVLHINGGLY